MSVHPLVRLFFSLILMSVWFVSDAKKIGIIALVTFIVLFTVPDNPISRPKTFFSAFMIFISFEVCYHLALGATSISIPVLLLGIKFLCLGASAVVLLSGLGFQGLLYLTTAVFPQASVLVPVVNSGLSRVHFAYEQIRLRQKANGIGLTLSPTQFIYTLSYRVIWYLLLLSEDLEIQLGVKWYGAPTYKSRLDLKFRIADWLLSLLGIGILFILIFI